MYEPGPEKKLGGYTTTAFRLQLLWEPNDKFSGLLKVHGWDVDGTARIFRANIFEPGSNNLVSGFRQDQVWHDGKNEQDIESRGGLLRLEYDLGAATLTSITGYETLEMFSRGDIDGGVAGLGPGFIPFSAESADGLPYLDQWTEEIRIASNGGGDWNWLAGFFYFNEELQADTWSFDSDSPGNPVNGFTFLKSDVPCWIA